MRHYGAWLTLKAAVGTCFPLNRRAGMNVSAEVSFE